MTSWRFIPYSEYDGDLNMAVDEMLLEANLAGTAQPTLRLYGFKPPAVSIGLSQRLDKETLDRLAKSGIDVVRRPTGGRAVLHLDDITYSFIGMDEEHGGLLKGSVTAAYKQICQGLQIALKQLGVQAEIGESQAPYRHLADCFLATTPADLHYNGRKLAGSAQLRRKGGVLQHGSIPLKQEQNAMTKLLNAEDDSDTQAARHVNLFDVIDRCSMEHFDAAFKTGFEEAFGVTLKEAPLTEEELLHARRFMPESVKASH